MQRSQFRFFHRLRVRWAEVDMQKIVFNAHYLMYVDSAMSDYWRALALPYEQSMLVLGGEMYVKKATLEFHASARLDDSLEVGMRCARIGNSSCLFEAGIFRGDQLLISAELVYVFANQRPRPPCRCPLHCAPCSIALRPDKPWWTCAPATGTRWDAMQAACVPLCLCTSKALRRISRPTRWMPRRAMR